MSAAGVSLDLVRELRAICGGDHVAEAGEALPLAASPASADEVAAIVSLANQRGFSIAPVGGHGNAAPATNPDVLLRMHRLNEVEHYDPADLTVGVGAGMTVAQLSALLEDANLMFGCDPAFPALTTIGGVLAAAKHGPLRQGFGGVRDFCIGIRFVTGDGRKAKGGGRVVKNVAGYDLMKLLIGSYGSLAVITSASFKLFPAPRQTRTFLAEFATWQEALKFRNQVVRSPLSPTCLEIVSPLARKMMRPDVTDDAWVICICGAGSDAVLARYHKELGSAVTREMEGDEEQHMWSVLEQFPYGQNPDEQAYHTCSLFAPPAQLDETLRALQDGHSSPACIGRVGLGHLLIAVPAVDGQAVWSLDVLRHRLPIAVQVVNHWSGLDTMPSMRAVKQALDANNVLRGRELA